MDLLVDAKLIIDFTPYVWPFMTIR